MNFSWLSGGDERRARDPGDGSSLPLTRHREVHRLQSLSMRPNRHHCSNYPALSSVRPSIKTGGRLKEEAEEAESMGGGREIHLLPCPPTSESGVTETRGPHPCHLAPDSRVVSRNSSSVNSTLHHLFIHEILVEDKSIKHQTAVSLLLYSTYHEAEINGLHLHDVVSTEWMNEKCVLYCMPPPPHTAFIWYSGRILR